MPVAYNKFQSFVGAQNAGSWAPGSDTLKLMLSNTAPSSTMALVAEITEISGVNGYTAGGASVTVTNSGQTAGTYSLKANGILLTATTANSTAGFGPARYAVLYDFTISSGPLIAWWDYGSSFTVNPAETLAWNPNSSTSNGTIFTET